MQKSIPLREVFLYISTRFRQIDALMSIKHYTPLSLVGSFSILAIAVGAMWVPREEPLASAQQPKPTFERNIAPLVKKYCGECHGAKDPLSGLALTQMTKHADFSANRDIWDRVAANLHAKTMPPQGSPQPTDAERKLLVEWIESTLSAECDVADPGRVTLRRLNRAEYNNTIRDLFGINFKPADDFPSDDVGYGFDNIGDVLSISPLLMEKYLDAAEKIAEAAVPLPLRAKRKIGAPELDGDSSASDGEGRILFSNGEVGVAHQFPAKGRYTIKIRAYGHQAGSEPPKMTVRVGAQLLKTIDVPNEQSQPVDYVVEAVVEKGRHQVAFGFINDYYDPEFADANRRDRNLILLSAEIDGPLEESTGESSPQRRVIPREIDLSNWKAAAKTVLTPLATKAYRRPVKPDELDRLVAITELAQKNNEPFEQGIRLGVMAMLTSPHFLFRVELDPPAAAGKPYELGPYEVASRLSYFLWSSMPDDELFRLASQDRLKDPTVLEAQVKRMLADPRAEALAENFADQWLQLRKLTIVTPDPDVYPSFSDQLKRDMATETRLLFNHIVGQDRSVVEFIDADYTFVNERLAKHYGWDGISGDQFRHVKIPDERRGGVLTHASVLTLTSNPTRTSPVKRGKWVLENILGTPPPPPPPGVGDLKDDEKHIDPTASLRVRMEQHRQDPTCASCHARMDPIGFSLENFDGVGAWRLKDGKFEIDATGELPDGSYFDGPIELRGVLLDKKDMFVKALAEKLITYGIGRGLRVEDRCYVDDALRAARNHDYKFSALIISIVTSDVFTVQNPIGRTP